MTMMKDNINLAQLWQAWPIAGPWHLSPLSGGTNNLVWHAEATAGERYVLHLFPDLSQLPRRRYEATLLSALSNVDLPFRVPLPIKTRNGEDIAFLEHEVETLAFAILSPLLPGEHPDRNDPTLAFSGGVAMAVLDNTLASLPEIITPAGFEPTLSFGDFVHGHGPLPDPLAAIERLPIEHDKVQRIQSIFASVLEEVDDLYVHLPQQLLHLDCDPANIFMKDRRVTAIFDFEFAGIDLRVMELCVALSWWPLYLMGTGKEWEVMDALARAYLAGFPLREEELRAIPSVLRLRDIGSLVHRMGRYFSGLETDITMQKRVEHSLWREEWLVVHNKMLLHHVMSWN
jgi:homoserine kinase type II